MKRLLIALILAAVVGVVASFVLRGPLLGVPSSSGGHVLVVAADMPVGPAPLVAVASPAEALRTIRRRGRLRRRP